MRLISHGFSFNQIKYMIMNERKKVINIVNALDDVIIKLKKLSSDEFFHEEFINEQRLFIEIATENLKVLL